jgi:hypothetical protein
MAKLTIQRKGGFITQREAFKILIDGKKSGTIYEQKILEFDLTNENHRLQFVGGWGTRTTEISFSSTSRKIFEISVHPIIDWFSQSLLFIRLALF